MAKYVKTGGRKPGARNRSTIEREMRAQAGIASAIEGGALPLDILLTVMRGGPEAEAITARQYEAAVAAAPYLHPRLASSSINASIRRNIADFTDAELLALAGPDDGEAGDGEAGSGPH
ncbi:hypothetical protein [Roseicella sp. DB1501]|uniref:hypothetical protein n=1 Tax=Roseicella sp. DB1501 TaxID=2730925 RepID=UPI001492D9FC|nr:hypothetical protein [Roseicella sp. DB1501]NOG74227.1 hypothetical protein [Roseicella sp. DB1501]